MKETVRNVAHFAEFMASLLAPLAFVFMPIWLPHLF